MYLNRGALFGRAARKKCLSRAQHKEVQLEYARKHIDESKIFSYKFIWLDETYIILYTELYGHSHHRYAWRQVHQEYQEMNTIAAVKHGCGSLILLGCVSANCTGKLVKIAGKSNAVGY